MSAWRNALTAALMISASWGSVEPVLACNLCREDKIAATYDWQVVSASRRRGHAVVFSEIRGPITPGDARLARSIARTVAAVSGVDAGTVRVSLAPPALSFACDPSKYPPAAQVAAINLRLRSHRLALATVQVGEKGSSEPSLDRGTERP